MGQKMKLAMGKHLEAGKIIDATKREESQRMLPKGSNEWTKVMQMNG